MSSHSFFLEFIEAHQWIRGDESESELTKDERGHDVRALTFRAAGEDDWLQVAALLEEADLPRDGVQDHLGDFLLAERSGALVGCAALERYDRHGLLRSVAVRRGDRGADLGQALVRRLLERAAADDLHNISLLTTTAADYFLRFGFRVISRAEVPTPVQRSVEFREACPASAVAMLLDLRPGVAI